MSPTDQNMLRLQSSPYLLQHQHNPVHWQPWSPDTLRLAREQGRPILLSIGYAACHWCHVMAHESFEDEDVAAVMNRLFVNIKVDREERPDIDQIYMAALTAMGEQGGWPLTLFLTPDAKPFWGGTYFPRQPRYGRPGFIQVLEAVHSAWVEKRDGIADNADKLEGFVAGRLSRNASPAEFSAESFRHLAEAVAGLIDPEKGGLKGAPKFPNAPLMETLWLEWLQSGDPTYRQAVIISAQSMLNGGIYDHVGGGLCRYSTDADWLVPHFEKMLYDNAQLIRLCGWLFAETGNALFRQRIEGTISWLLREMRDAPGAFVSSLDADSDGVEGLFYTWTEDEIGAILGLDASEFIHNYKLSSPDGWEGHPVLHRQGTDPADPLTAATSLEKLRAAREARSRPARDDKILTDWNGLAIRALAQAGRQFNEPSWIDAAERAYRFIAESKDRADRLPHSILGARRLYPALSSDYAAMTNAAITLYEATDDQRYLDDSATWVEQLNRWHLDARKTGYFLTASDATDVPIRPRGDVDDAMPSATGQVIEALARLASVLGDDQLAVHCWQIVEHALGRIAGQSYGQAGILNAASIAANPWKLLLVENRDAGFVPVANRLPDPRRIDARIAIGAKSETGKLPGGVVPDTTRPSAWLCRDQACLPPIFDPAELEDALRTKPAG